MVDNSKGVNGLILHNALAELDAVFANVGKSYTFIWKGLRPLVDLTYVSINLAKRAA